MTRQNTSGVITRPYGGTVRGDRGKPISIGRAGLSAGWLLLLVAGAPAGLLVTADVRRVDASVVVAALVVVYAGVRLAALVWGGTPRVLQLTFWVYAYVWLGLAALLQLLADRFPWPGAYDNELVLGVLVSIILGFVSYEVGLKMPVSSARGVVARILTRQISGPRTVVLALTAAALGAALVSAIGGVGTILVSRAEFQRAFASFGPGQGLALPMLIKVGLNIPAFVGLLASWVLWLERKHAPVRLRRWLAASLVAMLLVNAVVNNPIYSPRAWVGTIVLSIVFAATTWRRAVSPSLWVGGLLALFIVAFPYSDVFRTADGLGRGLETDEVSYQLVTSGDYASFQQLLNARRYVRDEGYRFGRQLAGAALVWIPRSVWTSKPIDSGDLVADHAGYTYRNLEMPLWGELFIDGGGLAVVVGFFLFGWLTVRIERTMVDLRGGRDRLGLVIVATLVGFQVQLLRGDLMSNFMWLAVTIGLLFLISVRSVPASGNGPAGS